MWLQTVLGSPYVWLAVAAAAAILEAVSVSLITVWFVIGGIAAFFVSFFGGPAWAQAITFIVVSIACLALLRPVALKYRKRGESHEATPVGSQAIVIEDIDGAAQTGRVETPDRVTWIALSNDGSRIEAGANVRIVGNESIKLIVERI